MPGCQHRSPFRGIRCGALSRLDPGRLWNLRSRGRQTQISGPEPKRGRLHRRGAVSALHSRDARQVPGTFPGGQVPATGRRRGGAGWSRAPRRPVNQCSRSPGSPCQLKPDPGRSTLAADHRPLRSLGLEKGDVIVAGRFRKASPMGDWRSGLLSVALGQY